MKTAGMSSATPRNAPPLLKSLCPEARLLFLAARPYGADEHAAEIADLAAQALDWNVFCELARLHRVLPLAHATLAEYARQHVPKRAYAYLSAQTTMTTMRNEANLVELMRLDSRMREVGVEALHYKGATTALRMYPALGSRTFHDMDFIVSPGQVQRVCTQLEADGYQNKQQPTDRERRIFEKELKEYLYLKDGFNIEPHWRFTPRRYAFDLELDAIRRRDVKLDDHAGLLAPGPEDSLVLMMLVGASGFWKRLQMLSDIAACTHTFSTLDWHWLRAEMQRLRARRILLLSALLSHELCAAVIPDDLLAEARQHATVVRMARTVVEKLASVDRCRKASAHPPRQFQRLLWQMRDTLGDRLVYLARTTTTASHVHARRMPLSPQLHFLYRGLVPLHDYLAIPLSRHLRRLKAG
jgi:hypothetical protein|tara:strand:- start:420 stop:1658 length:1239 start_codon:yes stop_codon:yes gene_type:complete